MSAAECGATTGHPLAAEADAVIAFLSSLQLGALKRSAKVLGATVAQVDEIEEADDSKAAGVELVLQLFGDLHGMTIGGLKKRLRSAGLAETAIDDLDKSVEPKAAAIDQIIACASDAAKNNAAHMAAKALMDPTNLPFDEQQDAQIDGAMMHVPIDGTEGPASSRRPLNRCFSLKVKQELLSQAQATQHSCALVDCSEGPLGALLDAAAGQSNTDRGQQECEVMHDDNTPDISLPVDDSEAMCVDTPGHLPVHCEGAVGSTFERGDVVSYNYRRKQFVKARILAVYHGANPASYTVEYELPDGTSATTDTESEFLSADMRPTTAPPSASASVQCEHDSLKHKKKRRGRPTNPAYDRAIAAYHAGMPPAQALAEEGLGWIDKGGRAHAAARNIRNLHKRADAQKHRSAEKHQDNRIPRNPPASTPQADGHVPRARRSRKERDRPTKERRKAYKLSSVQVRKQSQADGTCVAVLCPALLAWRRCTLILAACDLQ